MRFLPIFASRERFISRSRSSDCFLYIFNFSSLERYLDSPSPLEPE